MQCYNKVRGAEMNLNEIFQKKQITENKNKVPRQKEDGGYFWYKGETIKLVWDIEGDCLVTDAGTGIETYISAENFMEDKEVKVKLFNNMGKKVKEWILNGVGTAISVEIDEGLSNELPTGTYTCSVGIYSPIGMVLEVVSRDVEFEVK